MRVQASLVVARLVSLIGDGFWFLALPLFAMHSLGVGPAHAAILYTAQALPGITGVAIGPLVDRARNPLAWSLAMDVLRVVVIALALAVPNYPLLLVAAAVLGFAAMTFDVGLEAFLPRAFGPDALLSTYSWFSRAAALARITGLAAGGVVIGWKGPTTGLALNALTFVASAIVLVPLLRISLTHPRDDASAPSSLARSLAHGVRILRADPPLAAVLLGVQWFNVNGAMVVALWVPYATLTAGLSTQAVGVVAAFGSAAALLVATAVPARTRRHGPRRIVVWGFAASIAANLAIPGAAYVAPLVMLLMYEVLDAGGGELITIPGAWLRQTRVDPAHQGALFGLLRTIRAIATPLGGLAAGAIAVLWSPLAAMTVAALLGMTLIPLLVWLWRQNDLDAEQRAESLEEAPWRS